MTRAIGTPAEPFALALAERRCRIAPPPSPLDYVLRAELLHRSGDQAAALADIAKALTIEPEHLIANRKRLAWAQFPEQVEAARCLFAIDPSAAQLQRALAILAADGAAAIGRVGVVDGRLQGWVAWDHVRPLAVRIEIDGRTTTFNARPGRGSSPGRCDGLGARN